MYRLYANSVILFKGLEHFQVLLSTGEPPKSFPLADQGKAVCTNGIYELSKCFSKLSS